MLLILLFFALASSGLAQAQLPSNLQQTPAGFAGSVQENLGTIRLLYGVGEYDVVFHTPSTTATMSVYRKGAKVFTSNDGDSLYGGTTLIAPNQSTRVTLSRDGKTLVFSTWCNPRPSGDLVFMSVCRSYTLDLSTKTIKRLIAVGDKFQQVKDVFGGTQSSLTVNDIRATPIVENGTIYGSFDLRSASNVSYAGLYEIKSNGQVTGLVGDTSSGHYFVTGNVGLTDNGILYTDSRANISATNDDVREFTFADRKSKVLLSTGNTIDGEVTSGSLIVRVDSANKSNFVTAGMTKTTYVRNGDKFSILFSTAKHKLDGQIISTQVSALSNGLVALPYRSGSNQRWWDHYGIAIKSADRLTAVLKTGDTVNGISVGGIGEQVAPHVCSVSAIDLDPSTRLYRRIVTAYPVIISRLTASPDGQLAQMGGCGFSLEGLPLDSVTIGGATAEVVGREIDASTGQDTLVLRPLSPVYAGMTEVAVTISGRRFASIINVEGPKAPELKILHYATKVESYDLAANTLAELVGPTGRPDSIPFLGDSMGTLERGGATVSVCGTPTYLFRNFGTSLLFLIPRELAGGDKTECEAVLRVNDREVGRKTIRLVELSPGVFKIPTRRLPSGELDPQSGVASFFDAVGNLISTPVELIPNAHPAYPGLTIALYGTGFGPVFADGSRNVCAELSGAIRMPVVKVGGTPAYVSYCGEVPGTRGLYQINFEVPPGTEVDPNGEAKMVPVWPWDDWRPDLEYFIPVVPPPAAPSEPPVTETKSTKNTSRLFSAPAGAQDELRLAIWRIVLENLVQFR